MCIKGVLRTIFFTFNVLCALVGIGLVTIGILYELPYYELSTNLPSEYQYLPGVPIALIAVGGLVTIISLLGCCGVFKYSPCLLNTYAALLLIIFIAEIGVGVFGFMSINNPQDLRQKIDNSLNAVFLDARDKNNTYQAYKIQESFQCCGRDGPDFWAKPPVSCYYGEEISESNLYRKGCVHKVVDFVKTSVLTMAIVVVALCIVALISSIIGFHLARRTLEEKSSNNYRYR